MRARRLAAVVVVCLLGSVAFADDDPLVKRARAEGAVLTDGKGHYFVFPIADLAAYEIERLERFAMWYGDSKTVYRVGSTTVMHEDDAVNYGISDPRIGLDQKNAELDAAPKPQMSCDGRVTALQVVPPADARKLLAKMVFKSPLFDRRVFAVAREGTTYYVVDGIDNDALSDKNKKARVFIGKRGAMKEIKIARLDIAADGATITTAKGVLRTTWVPTERVGANTYSKPKSSWTPKGGKLVELADLETKVNGRLIYSELGIYPARLGFPCDDM